MSAMRGQPPFLKKSKYLSAPAVTNRGYTNKTRLRGLKNYLGLSALAVELVG